MGAPDRRNWRIAYQVALYERLRGKQPAKPDLDEGGQVVEPIKEGEKTKTSPF
jgi:hypothetical protein